MYCKEKFQLEKMRSIIKVGIKTYSERSALRQGGYLARVGIDVYFMFDC